MMNEHTPLRRLFFLVTYAVLLVFLLWNPTRITHFIGTSALVLRPFAIGFVLAYLLTPVVNFFQFSFFAFLRKLPNPVWGKMVRPLSLLCTYVFALLLITAFFSIVIPEVASSLNLLIPNLSTYFQALEHWLSQLSTENPSIVTYLLQALDVGESLMARVAQYLAQAVPQILSTTFSIFGLLSNIIIGFIVSVYMLSSKDQLLQLSRRLSRAILPASWNASLLKLLAFTHETFGRYLGGIVLSSLLLGLLCYLCMLILGMPYAMLISLVVGVSNLIPIFGPLLGGVFGAFILVVSDPMTALWFIVLIIILQQLDSNVIVPRVLGDSMGMPGLFVMVGVLIGGSLGGVMGMILGVPICAVLYRSVQDWIDSRLERKTHGAPLPRKNE